MAAATPASSVRDAEGRWSGRGEALASAKRRTTLLLWAAASRRTDEFSRRGALAANGGGGTCLATADSVVEGSFSAGVAIRSATPCGSGFGGSSGSGSGAGAGGFAGRRDRARAREMTVAGTRCTAASSGGGEGGVMVRIATETDVVSWRGVSRGCEVNSRARPAWSNSAKANAEGRVCRRGGMLLFAT